MFIFVAGYIGLLRVIGESSDITKFITCVFRTKANPDSGASRTPIPW